MDRLPEAEGEIRKEQKMKKLMIAAVAAAMAGVTIADDCCGCEDTCSTKCVYAYEVILLAKTTSGKPVVVMPKQSTCGCACEEVAPCSSSCYRKPLMRKFAGFVFGNAAEEEPECGTQGGDGICGSACNCVDFSANENQVFWDVKTKRLLADAAFTFTKLDAIGYQSRETVEAVAEFAFTEGDDAIEGKVTLAGFGKRGKRSNGVIMLKNLSGFFAGYYPCLCTSCAYDSSICGDTCETSIAVPWSLCCDEVVEDDEGTTAAYGKWTFKWNETAAQRLTKSFTKAALVKPGYEVPAED